jgi:hypothetical protein
MKEQRRYQTLHYAQCEVFGYNSSVYKYSTVLGSYAVSIGKGFQLFEPVKIAITSQKT